MSKGVLFDLWGTLFYNKAGKSNHYISVFARKLGCDPHDGNFLTAFERGLMKEKHEDLRIPVRKIAEALGVEASEEIVEDLAALLDVRNNHVKKTIRPYSDTFRTLKALRGWGFKLGLLTNAYYQSMEALEEKYPIGDYFDAEVKSYEVGEVKPHPKMFCTAADKLGVDKHDAMMVGDSINDDMKGANACGMPSVLIDREGKHPSYARRIATLDELWSYVAQP